jgi:nicotinamide-nucleotide amidase
LADDSLRSLAAAVLDACRAKRLRLAMAESCTGGMVAAALTDIPGSSDIVERGLVTYSNDAKSELLGIPPAIIQQHGAVSAEVAGAMAAGALAHAPVDLAVGITGIAGPDGGSREKPVGLVWFGIVAKGAEAKTESQVFQGDRAAVRAAATRRALELLLATATASKSR